MRPLLFFIFFLFLLVNIQAQNPTAIASSAYQDVKYAFAMVDHTKMAYDGTNMKKLGGSMFDVADKAFYNGKYVNAASRYMNGFSMFPQVPSTSSTAFWEFSLAKTALVVDEQALDMLNARIYTGGLNTLGIYYHNLGRYEKALQFYDLSMKIRAKRFGKTGAPFLNSLQNIALLKKDLGEYAEAEHIFNYLSKSIPQLFTENSFHYAIFLNNKAMLYATLGRNEEALSLMTEAISKGKEYLPENYFDLERMYINQGFLYMKTGQYEEARSALLRAEAGMREKDYVRHPDFNDLMIYIGRLYLETSSANAVGYIESAIDGALQRYGSDHILYARALENRALYHLKNRNFEKASEAFGSISEIRKEKLGDQNQDYLSSRVMLALCEWEKGNIAASAAIFKNSIDTYIRLIDRLFPAFSENEKSEFWSAIKPDLYLYYSFVKYNYKAVPDITKHALNVHLRTKGILINASSAVKETILASGDEDMVNIYNEWKEVHDQLAYYYSVPKEQADEDKVDLAELEAKANELEKSLSRRSSKFAGKIEKFGDYFSEISGVLQEGEGALEIVRAEPVEGRDSGKASYLGFLIRSGRSNPELIVLEDGSDLENRHLKLYKNKMLFKLEDRDSYSNYWKPFNSATSGLKHLYISFDGIYNNVSITSLRDETGAFLLDQRNWTVLTNCRTIPKIKKNETDIQASNAILFGNPKFGNAMNVSPLPGTGVEVENISGLLKEKGYEVSVFTQDQASENNILEIRAPSVLHMATHGYFFSDVKAGEGMILGIQVDKAKNNPLLRSGLILSNANQASAEDINASKTNGLLNAFEAMSLDLEGTGLVVLSACETGKGEIVNGEGVYGLPRALQVAGAENVIMSLWKVDDAVTQELMDNFYRQWLGGKELEEALLLAQRNIKEKYEHPYYWGAFVLVKN